MTKTQSGRQIDNQPVKHIGKQADGYLERHTEGQTGFQKRYKHTSQVNRAASTKSSFQASREAGWQAGGQKGIQAGRERQVDRQSGR